MNFILEKYRKEMIDICGDMKDCKFPDSYYGNLRPWDYSQIIEHGEFDNSNDVLDTGALHTYFCIYLSQYVKSYICTDSFYWAERDYCQDKNYYQTPKEWCEYIGKKSHGKVKGEEADLQKLQYPDNSFDRVLSISVIEHVLDDRKGIEEMMRVLKPNGLLLMTTEYNPVVSKEYSETDGSFYRVYDRLGVDALVKGFTVEAEGMHYEPNADSFTSLFMKIRKSNK